MLKQNQTGFAAAGLAIILGGGILVAIAAGGILMFNPNEALKQSLAMLATAKSFESQINFEFESRAGKRNEGRILMGFDAIDLESPKLNLELEAKDDRGRPLKLSARGFAETLYLRVDAVAALSDELGNFRAFLEEKVLGQWIKIDLKGLEEKLKEAPPPLMDKEIPELKPEKIQEFREALSKARIFERKGLPRPTLIDRTPSWIIEVKLDPEGTANFLKDLSRVMGKEPTQAEIEQVIAEIEKFNKDYDLTIWIDWQNYPRKIQLKRKAAAKPQAVRQAQLVSLSVQFRGFNKPLIVDIPTESRPAEELMQEFFGQLFFGPTGLAPRTNLQQLMPLPGSRPPEINIEELEQQLQILQQLRK